MTEATKVRGVQVLQAIGGIALFFGSFILKNVNDDVRALKGEMTIVQTSHAALSARVSSEREDTLRSLNRIEGTLNRMDAKVDTIKQTVQEKKP